MSFVTHLTRAASGRRQPAWYCVPLQDSDLAMILDGEREVLVPARLVETAATAPTPTLLGGRRLRFGMGADPQQHLHGPRRHIIGRWLSALLPAAEAEIWEQLDRILGNPCYIIATDWLQPAMDAALQGARHGCGTLLPIRVGEQGTLWLGPELPAAEAITAWTRLRAHLIQSRPLRGFLLAQHGRLPDALPFTSATVVANSLQRAAALLARWPARRLLRHGIISLSPGQRARLHRLWPVAVRREGKGSLLRPARRWISPLLGPLYHVQCAPQANLAGFFAAQAESTDNTGWADVQALQHNVLFRGGGGCSEQPELALGAAIAEAFERLAAVDDGAASGVRAPVTALQGARGWHELRPLAPWQHALAGQRLLAARHPLPRFVSKTESLDWIQVRYLRTGKACWVPRALVLFGEDGLPEPHAHSDGLAAAPSRHQAVQRGLLELIERDAVGIWWHGRILRPPPPRQAWEDPVVERLAKALRPLNRQLWLLNLTHDLGVPVVAAVSADADGSRVIVGAAAGWSFTAAGRAAVLELAQMEPLAGLPEQQLSASDLEWRTQADTQHCPWLLPHAQHCAAPADITTIGMLLARLRRMGLDPLWVDLGRSWMPVAVTRVIVPGLCSHRPWFGYRRLREVPAQLGWQATFHEHSQALQLYW